MSSNSKEINEQEVSVVLHYCMMGPHLVKVEAVGDEKFMGYVLSMTVDGFRLAENNRATKVILYKDVTHLLTIMINDGGLDGDATMH